MQSASSRIWTRVAVSISYDDNNYTTGTSVGNHSCELDDQTSENEIKGLNSQYQVSDIFQVLYYKV